MARLTGWWMLVLAIVVVASTLRYEARQAYASTNTGQPLAAAIERVLTEGGFEIVGEIGDPHDLRATVGSRFSDGTCPADMTVAEFPITKIAKAFTEELTTGGDSHRYFFHDFSYETSARPSLVLHWGRHLLMGALGIGTESSVRNQIVVLWPKDCAEPDVDWSAVWRDEPRRGAL